MIVPVTSGSFESPSLLASAGRGQAFELKFLVDRARAVEVEAWAQTWLSLDAHGEPALGGAYRTLSLYYDTPQLDVYHRAAEHKRRKFRVRRYGDGSLVFLERKSRRGDRVRKKRTAVPVGELHQLTGDVLAGAKRLNGSGEPIDSPADHDLPGREWAGRWFHMQLGWRGLRPACLVEYLRTAYRCATTASTLRLTLDRNLLGILTNEPQLAVNHTTLPLLADGVVLELKFCGSLPAVFRALVADMRLTPTAVSKYRLCHEAWGTPKLALRGPACSSC